MWAKKSKTKTQLFAMQQHQNKQWTKISLSRATSDSMHSQEYRTMHSMRMNWHCAHNATMFQQLDSNVYVYNWRLYNTYYVQNTVHTLRPKCIIHQCWWHLCRRKTKGILVLAISMVFVDKYSTHAFIAAVCGPC